MNKLLRRLLAPFATLLALGSAAPAEARAPQAAKPALWEVSDPDTTIYLFGTIHLLPEHMQWRTPAFDNAVAQSQELVVETIVDQQHPEAIAAAEMSLGFKRGLPPITKRVPPTQVAKLKAAIAKSGVPEPVFDQMKTWLAFVQLAGVQFRAMGLKGADGPEEILRQQFLSANKPIGELETNLEQFGYFDRMSEQSQRQLLVGALEEGNADKEFSGMLASWSRGDVKAIGVTFNHELAATPEIRKFLLQQRNANWARWIEQRLASPGAILVAVGAGHLAGKGSVIDLLKKDGYQVRRLQ
jgi:uncharacterized protein YbaP (TraB family)